MTDTIRAFIALELSPEVHQELKRAQQQLKQSGADVKWVNPESIHLTLKFLGNLKLELIEEINKVLDQLVKEYRPFELSLKGLEAFPKVEYPRVIWAGIERGGDKTISIAQDLEKRLSRLGFLPEKRAFKPHLTLGRVRSAQKRAQLVKSLQSVKLNPQIMQAKNLTLFKSTLTPKGAIYETIHSTLLS